MNRSWLAVAALTGLGAELPVIPVHAAPLFSAPASVSFGDVLVGQSSSLPLTATVLTATKPHPTTITMQAATTPFSGGPSSQTVSTKSQVTGTYMFSPSTRGSVSENIAVQGVNLGLKTTQNASVALTGTGVAPIATVANSAAPTVRVGTTGTQTVTVTNLGDGNLSHLGAASNLLGSAPSLAGVFSGPGGSISLTDGADQTFSYSFAPAARGPASETATIAFTNGSADGTNQATDAHVPLSGLGVGPVYDSAPTPGSTISFGQFHAGQTGFADLLVSNSSTDAGPVTLTGLSLLSASFTGSPDFTLAGFTPTVIDAGDMLDLKLDFAALGSGLQTASLMLTTDQDAAFGAPGDTFTYLLSATVLSPVPEPGTFILVGVGLGGLLLARKRPLKKR